MSVAPWLTWHSFRTWRPWHPWHEPLQNYRSVQNFESKLNLKLLSVSNLSCIYIKRKESQLRYHFLVAIANYTKAESVFCTSDLWTVVRTNVSVYWRGHKKSDEKKWWYQGRNELEMQSREQKSHMRHHHLRLLISIPF